LPCRPAQEAIPADGSLWELKHDGFHAFVRHSSVTVELLSRNGRSMAN
jgi:hypothetical protein